MTNPTRVQRISGVMKAMPGRSSRPMASPAMSHPTQKIAPDAVYRQIMIGA